jgi:hypothetical protein
LLRFFSIEKKGLSPEARSPIFRLKATRDGIGWCSDGLLGWYRGYCFSGTFGQRSDVVNGWRGEEFGESGGPAHFDLVQHWRGAEAEVEAQVA